MKVAILSDIHGNVPALDAVTADIDAWAPDLVVVNGDVINRGPDSSGALDRITARERSGAWRVVQGNHEEYVLGAALPATDAGARETRQAALHQLATWTAAQLNGALDAVAAWPDHLLCQLPSGPRGVELAFYHASVQGNRDGIFPQAAPERVLAQIGPTSAPPPAVFATAHIHTAYVRELEDVLLVNSGSVGSPCDGDLRASYARLTWLDGRWHAAIQRVDYNRAATRDAYEASDFFEGCGPVSWLIYHEWRTGLWFVPPWFHRYEARVLDGEIGLDAAIDDYLAERGVGRCL